jgi:hypothetical protein
MVTLTCYWKFYSSANHNSCFGFLTETWIFSFVRDLCGSFFIPQAIFWRFLVNRSVPSLSLSDCFLLSNLFIYLFRGTGIWNQGIPELLHQPSSCDPHDLCLLSS